MLVQVTLPLAAANVMNQAARMVMAIVGPVLAVELGFDDFNLVKSDRFGGRWKVGGVDPMTPTIPFEALLQRVKSA